MWGGCATAHPGEPSFQWSLTMLHAGLEPSGTCGCCILSSGCPSSSEILPCLSQFQQNSSSRFPCRFRFLGTRIGGEGWGNTVLHSELPSLFYEIVVVFACVWLPACLPASRVSLRGSSHPYDWAPDVRTPFRLQGHDKEADGALTAHGSNKEMNFTWYLHIDMLLRITHDLLYINILKCSLVTHSPIYFANIFELRLFTHF